MIDPDISNVFRDKDKRGILIFVLIELLFIFGLCALALLRVI